jgi:hypothetical protein
MPALPNVPNVLRLQLGWSDDQDQSVLSNFFFRYSGGPPDAADCLSIAGAAATAMTANAGAWHPDTSLTSAGVIDLSTNESAEGFHAVGVPGSLTGTPLAGGTALLVNYHIARRYRGGKPRNYLPWGSSFTLQNRQNWTSTYVGEAQGNITDFLTMMIGASGGSTTITQHVNVSYYEGFTTPPVAPGKRAKNISTPRAVPVIDQILSSSVNVHPASQRRRNRG